MRPNFLWLVTEDNTAAWNGPYGDPLARTPHLDALAAEGIVFEQAHCTAPVCAPARCGLITGRHPAGLGTQHMRSARPLPADVRLLPELLRGAGYFCCNCAKTDYNTSRPAEPAWDRCDEAAHWRQRRPGQPFFAAFHFAQTHESALFERQACPVDPAAVRVPEYLPDTPETRADIAQFYGAMSRADAAVGQVLGQLEADGLAADTIVFYFADHGGALPRSKRFLYDNGTRVPLIVRFPRRYGHLAPTPPGGRISDLVSHLDLAATLVELAGLPRPAQFEGRAWAGLRTDPPPGVVHACRGRMDERYDFSNAATDGRFRYIRNYLPHRPAGQHVSYMYFAASMRRWAELHRAGRLPAVQRAFFEPRPAEELYDGGTDPDNVRNVAGEVRLKDVLLRLREAVRRQQLRVRDTGFFPEAMMVREADGGPPASVAADPSRYPLPRLIEFNEAAQFGRADPASIAAALGDPLPVVRYWGVIAALLRGARPEAQLDDPDPSVRVAAAEAVLRRGQHAGAWRRLAEALEPKQIPELRLAALNALVFLAKPPGEVSNRVAEAANEADVPGAAPIDAAWSSYVRNAARHLVQRTATGARLTEDATTNPSALAQRAPPLA